MLKKKIFSKYLLTFFFTLQYFFFKLKNNYNRNLLISADLLIYLPQFSSMLSIFHRITALVLTLTAYIFILSILNFASFLDNISNFLVYLNVIFDFFYIYLLLLFFFIYHFLNGIRHLFWDFFIFFNLYEIGVKIVFGSILLLILCFNHFFFSIFALK